MINVTDLCNVAGDVAGHVDLSISLDGQINLTVNSPDGYAGILLACDLSSAAARKLALALLQAAEASEGGQQ